MLLIHKLKMWQILFFALPPQIKAPKIHAIEKQEYKLNIKDHKKNIKNKMKYYERRNPPKYKQFKY